MNKTDNSILMERVLNRLQTESKDSITASTGQLSQATNRLIHDVKELNAAFSAPSRMQPIACARNSGRR
jgi:hypothetical protein